MKDLKSLSFVRSLEYENVGRASAHGRVQRVEAVSAHQHSGRQVAVGQPVDPANERIHARAIFMMHLIGFSGLRERIGLNPPERRIGQTAYETRVAALIDLYGGGRFAAELAVHGQAVRAGEIKP